MERDNNLRVGDAERTRVTEALHDHFAQGRLTRDELDERLDATLSAKTYGDLRRVTQDLPMAGVAQPDQAIARPRLRRPRRVPFLAPLVIAFLVIGALSAGPWGVLLGVILFVAVMKAMFGFGHARHWQRHGPWSYDSCAGRGPWRR